MPLKKNDICEILIEDLGIAGEGIGKYEGYTLFVKDALIGDTAEVKVIKAKKNYGYGRLMRIIKPSPLRTEPVCENARACGGCQIQHMDYKEQLKYKQQKVAGLLSHIGGVSEYTMHPIIGMENPYNYRNKAQFPVGRDKDGHIVTGFYAGRTHAIVPARHCYIQNPVNEQITEIVCTWMEKNSVSVYDENTHQGFVRHILTRVGHSTGEIMVCLVINGRKLPHTDALVERLKEIRGMTSICLNINTDKTNVILGDKIVCLWGREYILDYIGDVKYRISPLSFYQVNPIQTRKLYDTALKYAALEPGDVVWDLYCGIGTISLFMARHASKVYGVEIVPQAIKDARENARINGIKNAEFFVGKAEEVLPWEYEEHKVYANVIVVDPPRKGCDEKLLECMVRMAPERIVYVSCDPATLARDVKMLGANGYQLKDVQCVDMFAHSVHVESVVLLTRINAGN